jgi:hypothetical protein
MSRHAVFRFQLLRAEWSNLEDALHCYPGIWAKLILAANVTYLDRSRPHMATYSPLQAPVNFTPLNGEKQRTATGYCKG